MESKNPFSQGSISSETISITPSQTPVETSTREEESELLLPAIAFLEQNYQFRRNVLSGMVEYKKNGQDDNLYQSLSNATINTFIIKAKVEMPDETNLKSDIKTFLESDIIPLHDPVKEYFDRLPEWDGTDRIADFWKRIPGLSDSKINYLHIWHLSTVVH